MKYLLNLYSVFVARRFEALYHSPSYKKNVKAQKVLEHYRSIRRLLPIMHDGNHYGNHNGSNKKPFYATQGIR